MDDYIAPMHEEPQTIEGTADDAWSLSNLLSLDGGGIRGLWTLLVLDKLMEYIAAEEEKLGEREGNDLSRLPCSSFSPEPYPPHVSQIHHDESATSRTLRYLPCHYFDYICGSSTGALIAIMLGRFRMTVPDCIDEYKKLGGSVFGKPRFFTELRFPFLTSRKKYDAEKLQRVFKEVTTRRNQQPTNETLFITFPTDHDLCKTFATSLVSYSDRTASKSLYLLRSYDHNFKPSRRGTRQTERSYTGQRSNSGTGTTRRRFVNYGRATNFEVWQVARAATAAPWYFDELKVPIRPGSHNHTLFTDGGFDLTNNPTGQGVSEIKEATGNDSVGIVVSIGTARCDDGAGSSLVARLKGNIARSTDPERIHQDMDGACRGEGGFSYHRLNAPGTLDMELDEWLPRGTGKITLDKITNSFNGWAVHHLTNSNFRRCAKELVKRRRARTTDRALWERYATGAKFTCDSQGCRMEVFSNHNLFHEHLTRKHQISPNALDEETRRCKTEWTYQPPDEVNIH